MPAPPWQWRPLGAYMWLTVHATVSGRQQSRLCTALAYRPRASRWPASSHWMERLALINAHFHKPSKVFPSKRVDPPQEKFGYTHGPNISTCVLSPCVSCKPMRLSQTSSTHNSSSFRRRRPIHHGRFSHVMI